MQTQPTQETLTNAERWRLNSPADPALFVNPSRRFWRGLCSFLILIAVILTLFVVLGGAIANAMPILPVVDRPEKPHVVILTSAGCLPCDVLKAEGMQALDRCEVHIVQFGSPEFERFYNAFEEAIPINAGGRALNMNYCGPLAARPPNLTVPSVWFPDGDGYWFGYKRSQHVYFKRWVDDQIVKAQESASEPKAFKRRVRPLEDVPLPTPEAPVTIPVQKPHVTWPRIQHDDTLISQNEYCEIQTTRAASDTLDGVIVIACVGNLTDSNVEIRAALAERIDRALGALVAETVGQGAQAYFVAEVADPATYAAMIDATGVDPSRGGDDGTPVVVHVLIPERIRGLKAVIAQRVEIAIANHFFETLHRASINPILQRLSGGTYEACVAAVTSRAGPSNPDGGPFQPFAFAVSAWIGERSDFARKILLRMGLIKE